MGARIQIRLPQLYPKQHKAIFDPARHVFIEASTKAGKTLGCIVWQIYQCCRRPGHHWWVAPVSGQARIAYERAKRMLDPRLYTYNDTRMMIRLRNGAVWSFRTGEKPDNLYGEDVWSVVIDEASRCRPEVWDAIRSTLTATRGPSRVIGNVKGRKNWFYRKAREAEAGKNGYAYHKLNAWDAVAGGVLARQEILDAKADLPEDVYAELFLAEASKDGSNPFGLLALERCCVPSLLPGPAVAYGVDLAKRLDYTVLTGLNESGSVCDLHRLQRTWKETIAFILRVVGDTPALVDSTGVGDPVLEQLQDEGGSNFEGYVFTSPSKQRLMLGLSVDFQQGATQYPAGWLEQELLDFEYVHTRTGVRYAAPEGYHDDGVCSYALARRMWKDRPAGAWWN